MLSSYFRVFRGFDRSVLLHFIAIGVIGFTVDGGVFSVVFNLFLLRLGYAPDFIGQVSSSGLLAFALCSLPAGVLGDRLGNRRAMMVGLSIMMFSNLGVALVEFVPNPFQSGWLFVTYIISFCGVALYFVNTAPFLMSSVSAEQRSHAFSIQSATISLAAFAGSILGGFLPSAFASFFAVSLESAAPYRYPLIIGSLVISGGILALASAKDGELHARLPDPLPSAPRRTYATLLRVPRLRKIDWRLIGSGFVGLMIVISTIRILQISGMAVTMTFFNVYMDAGLGAPTSQIGLITGMARLLAVPIVLALPLMSARWGNQQLVIWATLSAFLFMLPLALIAKPWAAGVGYMGIMAGSSIRYTSFMVFSMELVKPEQRSILSGISEMTAGLSFAGMALLGGYIIVREGYIALFLCGALLTLVGTTVFWGYFGTGSKIIAKTTKAAKP